MAMTGWAGATALLLPLLLSPVAPCKDDANQMARRSLVRLGSSFLVETPCLLGAVLY
jgi:hypothetical protein